MQCLKPSEILKLDKYEKNFASLMELYEANYIRLRLLAPSLRYITKHCASNIPGEPDLFLFLHKTHKYGIEFKLGYLLNGSVEPNVYIRVYLDARAAEAVSIQQESFIPGSVLNRKWHKNYFLYKWLYYCYQCGHRLYPTDQSAYEFSLFNS